MKEQLCVCDFAIKVIMLQVSPGAEIEVAKIFSEELQSIGRKYRIFKALGNYDLFIIYESPDFLPDVIDIGTIPHILKSNELLCFPWEIKNESWDTIKEGFDFKNLDKKILGLSFLKINPSSILRTGAGVEQSLISFCKTQEDLSILGSFGWNEILILVHGETIENTYDTLLKLSDLKIGYSEDNDKDNKNIELEALFLKTLSFLGINFGLIKKIQDEPNFLKSELKEYITENFFPQLYITCCPEFIGDIISDASACFGRTNIVMGAEDVSISDIKKMDTWGEFLTEVFNFRQRNKSKLFSTSVRINRKEDEAESNPEAESPNKSLMECFCSPVTLSKEEALLLKEKFDRTFQMLLLNTIYTFNNIIQNNIVRDAFIDMIPFAKEIKSIALSEDSTSKEVGIYIDHFIFGAQQRASSTYSGIDNIEYRFSAFKGGIQRVLQAIELLPKSMLQNIGLMWNGIVNAGEYNTYRSDLQVLNIPLESLFIPKRWWGLFHEIGHIATLNSDLLDFKDKTLEDFLGRIVGISKDHPEFPDFVDLCWEISADIFDYKFGFLKDMETYFGALWKYLEDYIKIKDVSENKKEKYLFRSFYVYLYDFIFNNKNCDFESLDKKKIEIYFNGFVKFLNDVKKQKSLPEISISEKISDKIVFTALSFRPLLLHLHNKYSQIVRHEKLIDIAFSEETNQIIDTIGKGQIYWQNIEHPEIIIYRLKKENISNPKTNIATILSFWNTFHLRFGKDLDEITRPLK